MAVNDITGVTGRAFRLSLRGAKLPSVTAINASSDKDPFRADTAGRINQILRASQNRLYTGKVSVAIGGDVKGAGIFEHQASVPRLEKEVPRIEGNRGLSKIRIRGRVKAGRGENELSPEAASKPADRSNCQKIT